MNEIIKEVKEYLKTFDPNYTLINYIDLKDYYVFNYMKEVDNPDGYVNKQKYNNKYYVSIIDNCCILYDKNSKNIYFVNVLGNKMLENINDRKVISII